MPVRYEKELLGEALAEWVGVSGKSRRKRIGLFLLFASSSKMNEFPVKENRQSPDLFFS